MTSSDKVSRRKSPPSTQTYKPGQSGNPRGRPKGAISKKLLTRKVMLRRVTRNVNGKKQTLTLLECAILAAREMQMEGNPTAASVLNEIMAKLRPGEDQPGTGFLLVPETLTPEEAEVQAERYNANAIEPGTDPASLEI